MRIASIADLHGIQYAKVLGGLDQNLQMSLRENAKLDKIILMDEPETYMHPEFDIPLPEDDTQHPLSKLRRDIVGK